MKAIKHLIMLLVAVLSSLMNGQIKNPLKSPALKFAGISASAEQYKISIVGQSTDMKWVAVRKWYYKNSDTILVFNRHIVQKPVLTLTKINSVEFLGKNKLLVSGEGKACFYDLKMKTEKEYQDIIQVEVNELKDGNSIFAIFYKGGILEIYDKNGNLKNRCTDVISFQALKEKGFLIRQKNISISRVSWVKDSELIPLFSTSASISQLKVSDDSTVIMINESVEHNIDGDKQVSRSKIHIVELITGKSLEFDFSNEKDFTNLTMSRIGTSNSFLLGLHKKTEADNQLLEIWYSNESNIKSVYQGKTLKKFYILNLSNETAEKLNEYSEEMFMAFTNNRYLLRYHPHQGQDYVFWKPTININLFDIVSAQETSLGDFAGVDYKAPQVIYSPDGRFILGSEDRKKWRIWNIENLMKREILSDDLKVPVFTDDGRSIYFNSSNGISIFDLASGNLTRMKETEGEASLVNININRQFNEYHFACQTINTEEPLLVKTVDPKNSLITFDVIEDRKKTTIISNTKDKLSDLSYNPSFNRFFFLAENYNKPQELYIQQNKENPRIIYSSNSTDQNASQFKQEIFNYFNSTGQPLKGTLYYPLNYDASKKYPMVVKVYQNQRAYAKEYLIKGYASYVAYDKRSLIERGYFVYEPDIVFGKKGTGIEALDCVDYALDALTNISSIDFKKVGLIGHSHGGYITNFIATQSNRFATYISGAGSSDIIRSYFSYNRNFHTPFYMQFESGQYEMPATFSEDKELYVKNNPIYYVDQVSAPILLWAGKKDENIFWEQAQEFYIGLKRNHKDAVALFYTKGDHSLSMSTQEKEDLHKRSAEWLDYFLKDQIDVEWIDKQMKDELIPDRKSSTDR
ncbi:S9 family peptidase [Chryseobacterium indoltheticum]|uniref:S9 family peptidase n=1 Tax=Chryseobacterium indoltheticum TaxID=254 RepID=UPI0019130FB9|nr:prolyl oligopeptidase family serine peptidase [Chryseobacterium indoltheticum]QQQ28932.1 prolyl oligopeptidase family serine peptidase [Chryseobacterium indoltheticum]